MYVVTDCIPIIRCVCRLGAVRLYSDLGEHHRCYSDVCFFTFVVHFTLVCMVYGVIQGPSDKLGQISDCNLSDFRKVINLK